jgi:hypothetical protein
MNRINAADREKTREFEAEASKLELLQKQSRSRK